MPVPPTAPNIRAELARHGISRVDIAKFLGVHVNTISNSVATEYRPLPDWLAHNIGYAVNTMTGKKVFVVDMIEGLRNSEISRPRGKRRLKRGAKTSLVRSWT